MTRIIEVNNIDWTALQLEAGDYSISTTQANGVYYLSENEDGENAIQSNGTINVTTQETRNIYLKSSNANGRISVSNFFFDKLRGGGGGQPTPTPIQLTFNSPLNKEGDAVSLNIDGNFQVLENGNLSLNLQSNADFQKLSQQVSQLAGLTLQFIGEINNTRAEVIANTQLLSNFVNEKLSRPPKNGDLVLTNDAYAFVYDGENQSWTDFGNAIIQIATTTSAGIIKLGTVNGELQDKGDGKVGVIGWNSVLTNSGDQNINGRLIFGNNYDKPIVFRRNGACYLRWEDREGVSSRAFIGFGSSSSENFNLTLYDENSNFLFNKKIQYSSNITPTDNNDLVNKKYVDDNTPTIATNQKAGLIKLGSGTTQGELIDKGEGVAGVAGWDNLPKLNNTNSFTNDNYILNDKFLKLGYNENDIKLSIAAVSGVKDALIEANQGILRLKSKQGVKISLEGSFVDCNNTKISNVSDPTNAQDVATKAYVDAKFAELRALLEKK
ncbi:TPA: hypothetical protein KLA94_001716 [Campylobacter jejuni]|nr:hypothetical protein [Campylobacter jejuni]